MRDTLFEIKELLKKYGIEPDEVTNKTSIQCLSMVSEELDDFFIDFSHKFHVNMNGFNFYDYFFEQVHPMYVLKDFFLRIIGNKKLEKKPLTIEHLVEVAERRRWFDPA